MAENYLPFELDLTGFSFKDYYKGEKELLTPQLIKAGYKIRGDWFSLDSDSFGPLVRGIKVITPEGIEGIIQYG